jgi:predicted molibdopterin-dependent oxidoreductase YjgC
MSEIRLFINDRAITVDEGCMVSAAVMIAGVTAFRRSISGDPRGPLCGMGICFECRVTIDGRRHSRSCQILCRDGMRVRTDD